MPTPASPPPECGKFGLVTVSDCNGAHVLRYLRLCDGRFFGGNTWSRVDGFAAGIHEMIDLKGMLGLIARIANAPAERYETYHLDSRDWSVVISREMSVHHLAEVFGCDEQAIRDHFAPLVSLT